MEKGANRELIVVLTVIALLALLVLKGKEVKREEEVYIQPINVEGNEDVTVQLVLKVGM